MRSRGLPGPEGFLGTVLRDIGLGRREACSQHAPPEPLVIAERTLDGSGYHVELTDSFLGPVATLTGPDGVSYRAWEPADALARLGKTMAVVGPVAAADGAFMRCRTGQMEILRFTELLSDARANPARASQGARGWERGLGLPSGAGKRRRLRIGNGACPGWLCSC